MRAFTFGGFAGFLAASSVLWAQNPAQSVPLEEQLLQVKRIYVAELTGGMPADQLRDLIITGLNSTRLFILTDNPDRADAVLKGAADDHAFVDIHDSSSSLATRRSVGRSVDNGSLLSRSSGAVGSAVSDNESHHINERKHEAYASVRLCNKDGDVLWSTTQESLGAKFQGASSDVASKIARQLLLDMTRARQEVHLQNAAAPSTSK